MKYLFEWVEDMSVGQMEIDLQHKQLFNQINILLSAIVNNVDEPTVDEAIKFLGQYIDGHLQYEENYMLENNYPDLEKHKIEHQDFIEHYDQIKKKREAGESFKLIALDIEQYLGNWLVKHIGELDQKYADYIARNKN